MFPYVCLATMPLFCEANWPRKYIAYCKSSLSFFTRKQLIGSCDGTSVNEFKNTREGESFYTASSEGSAENIFNLQANFTSRDQVDFERDNRLNSPTAKQTDALQTLEHEDNGVRAVCKRTKHARGATKRQRFVVSLLLFHMVLQFFLPYSHFITKVSSVSMLLETYVETKSLRL